VRPEGTIWVIPQKDILKVGFTKSQNIMDNGLLMYNVCYSEHTELDIVRGSPGQFVAISANVLARDVSWIK
jgi:hypothetical protein